MAKFSEARGSIHPNSLLGSLGTIMRVLEKFVGKSPATLISKIINVASEQALRQHMLSSERLYDNGFKRLL